MRSGVTKIILELALVVVGAFLLNSCGGQKGCPTCGTTVNGAYAVINVVPVPEHNPTGEPGGPFNSFDISWFDPIQQKVYTSDRIGLDVVVTDAAHNFAVNTIGGLNQVANAGTTPAHAGVKRPAKSKRFHPSLPVSVSSILRGRVTGSPDSAAGTRRSLPHSALPFLASAQMDSSAECQERSAALRAPMVSTLSQVPTAFL